VKHVVDKLEVSQRRACRVLEQHRSTQRYQPRIADDERRLIAEMHEHVRRNPRFGYRRIHTELHKSGWPVNRKRILRLWRKESFKVPRRQRKKRRLGTTENSVMRQRAGHRDHVWCWDFKHSRDERGRPLKWLSIMDEYTRESLVLEVARSIKASDVLDHLRDLFLIRGLPRHIRSDNGPEFIARAVRDFLAAANVGTLYIEPGSPWENGYAESFHSRLTDELINAEEFIDLPDAQEMAAWWRSFYNHRRPHSSLDYQTPAAFAAKLAVPPVGAAPLPPEQPASVTYPEHLTLTESGT
jgi:putative transposase